MSTISSLYDSLITRLAVALPSHLRLSNPYDLEQNPERFLNQGYGVAFGTGENTKQIVDCTLSMRMDIIVSVTRQFVGQETDHDGKATVEKNLFEDQLLVIKDFCNNITVGTIDFNGHGGVEFIVTDKSNFLALRSTFSIIYFESIHT